MNKKPKIGLIGFGKTGKAVATILLLSPTVSLQWILKKRKTLENRDAGEFLGIETEDNCKIYSTACISFEKLFETEPVDIIIDFSASESINFYGQIAANKDIKIISAVSHYQKEEQLTLKRLSEKTTVFWSPNITLGVNFLMFASKLLKKIAPWTDIEIIEEHFKGKEGISGTATKIADSLQLEQSSINSIRAGGIVGKHQVIFGFPYQTIRITHESIAREAFGTGILFVIENLVQIPKGYYKYEDILSPYFVPSSQI